eukprot:13966905-Alexandrium_andersonii.AAC.1
MKGQAKPRPHVRCPKQLCRNLQVATCYNIECVGNHVTTHAQALGMLARYLSAQQVRTVARGPNHCKCNGQWKGE